MTDKKVAIIIVNYNGSDYIGDCLSSLSKISYPAQQYEIIVIDNASTDGSEQIVERQFPTIKLIKNKQNTGFAQANNVGLKYAIDHNFDYAYALNQDTEVEPDFLEQAVELAQTDQSIGAVQSKLLLFDDKTKINSIGNVIQFLGFGYAGGHKTPDHKLLPTEIAYASGAAVLLRLSAIQAVGMFNEEFFMYHEDSDLSWRLWLRGYRVMLAPDSVVYHKYQFERSIQKYYYMERNRYLVTAQNYKLATFLVLLPAFALMELVMLVYSFYSGWTSELIKMYAYFLKWDNWKKMAATRKIIQKNRQVSDRAIIKRFAATIEFQDLQNPLLKYVGNPLFRVYWFFARLLIWW